MSITPKWKRTQYRAVINWLTKYKPQPDSPILEQLRGCLEAFHHLCAVDAWEKAANLIRRGVPVTTSTVPLNSYEDIYLEEALHNQLGDFSYYREQIDLCGKLIGKVNNEVDAYTLSNLGNTYTCLKQYETAIEYHKQSLGIAAGIGDKWAAAAAIHNLSDAYRLLKQFDLAALLGMRSLYIFACIQSPEMETAMMTLSKIALEIGIEEYAEIIEEQLQVIKQEEGGEQAVVGLRQLLFET
ncbi:tetratricopeptide repeat protein [Planktothrix sp. FACHB-1355]|uniref:Tetratricopeptide repeat protein n=2 Tax=Cyanophyceae TaxID=3028117 RepID=A0A926VAY9_9CYAN|nr:tetratricopeptide repeat protein [Aerosakkonema funiforme FACHB-1375]MBD3557583.1 tetratricopeptide repeat protein [Planktothrix sp. FACHB-1355]